MFSKDLYVKDIVLRLGGLFRVAEIWKYGLDLVRE